MTNAQDGRVPPSNCPICNKRLDAATSFSDAAMPTPGDISICLYCATKLVFGEDMQLEVMPDTTWQTLDAESKDLIRRAQHGIIMRNPRFAGAWPVKNEAEGARLLAKLEEEGRNVIGILMKRDKD